MKNLVFGFIIGIANIIPGVSGGTFALILGIYSKLLRAIGVWNSQYIAKLFKSIITLNLKLFANLILKKENIFLAKIGFGSVLAIVFISKFIKNMLENHYQITYGFFLGLILLSIYVPLSIIEKKRYRHLIWLFIGLFLTFFVLFSVDPSVKILQKSLSYQTITALNSNVSSHDIVEYFITFLVGMLAISAMILPGISGSFLLILFGKYYQIISAISRLNKLYIEDLTLLLVFGLGMILGMIVFATFFNYLFKKYKDQTLCFLIGLMIGSIYGLWPFKAYTIVDLYTKIDGNIVLLEDQKIFSNILIFPTNMRAILPVLIAFLFGVVVMIGFLFYEKQKKKV